MKTTDENRIRRLRRAARKKGLRVINQLGYGGGLWLYPNRPKMDAERWGEAGKLFFAVQAAERYLAAWTPPRK